ncbi:D(2)-like dopamine receptor isoform X2 [Mya arenaria]|uniref:D(2)-like dopamine receptor isoform X2 n=1 Tax=Mya arenaria TaxID=6604 RepID=UPI0022E50898|nr:D(2)-like dopamine receptor isoform X2 [Mya arenaria]
MVLSTMSNLGNTTTATTSATTPTEEIPTAYRVIEGIVLSLVICVSVIGNMSLWIVVLRSRALRTLTSMFILGLSTADLLVATVNMPLTVYTIVMGEWNLGYNACVLAGFVNMLTLVTSVMSLCNISLNRYVMVCHPSKFKDIYTVRNAVLMIIGVVTVSTFLSIPPLIGWSEYVYTPTHSFCFADWVNHMSYAFFMIGCCFGIPFSVMTVCNIRIVRSVRFSRLRVKTNSRNLNSSEINDSYFRRTRHTTLRSDGCTFYEDKNVASFDNSSFKLCGNQSLNSKGKIYESIEKDISIIEIDEEIQILDRETNKQTDEIEKCDNYINDSNQSMTKESNEIMTDGEEMVVVEKIFDAMIESDDKLIETIPDKTSTESMFQSKPLVNKINVEMNKSKTSNTQSLNDQNTSPSVKDSSLAHPPWKSTVEQFIQHPSPRPISPEPSSDTSIKIRPSSSVSVNPSRPFSMRQTPPFRRREELRLALSLTVVVVVFVICWLPYCISMILSIFASGKVPREFHMFTLLIGYANSGCNPIIYGVMNKRFKVGFERLFCFWRKSIDSSISSA